MFCEVVDAADNDGEEEVHIVNEGMMYKRSDPSTFTRANISDLEAVVAEHENAQRIMKLYVKDARSPQESLLHNGIADIALIDAPGLNRDSIKTTAVFARQEEIDVVVFVVSAENHFTLSAKEFLWNASNEKAYLFIVVNRFDQIKDKAKCKRLVLEQIKQLSPRTYEDAEDLVHFVDSNSALHSGAPNGSFEKLESDLRSFVLVKRSKSKLGPVTTYLDHLLSDVQLLSSSNAILAESERDQARAALALARPVLEEMKANREGLEDGLERVEEDGATKASSRTKVRLNEALERVRSGKPAEEGVEMPAYPGLLNVLDYTRDVKKALLASIDVSVKLAEDEARVITAGGVRAIGEMAEHYLPQGVERNRRVFMPQAMFSKPKRKRHSSVVGHGRMVAGGVHGLGISLSGRPELLDVSFFDILDIQHSISTHLKHSTEAGLDSHDAATGALSLVSVGFGALTLVGGQTLGLRGALEGLVRIGDLLGNSTARKWAIPVLGLCAAGATVYFVTELPNSIPKNVGRRIRENLVHGVTEDGLEMVQEELRFVGAHESRVARETRKVLRLASWDLRERFRVAMEERQREVRGKEECERQAVRAIGFFDETVKRAAGVSAVVHQ
jgi:mitofusin